jgi:hypothetical protein
MEKWIVYDMEKREGSFVGLDILGSAYTVLLFLLPLYTSREVSRVNRFYFL